MKAPMLAMAITIVVMSADTALGQTSRRMVQRVPDPTGSGVVQSYLVNGDGTRVAGSAEGLIWDNWGAFEWDLDSPTSSYAGDFQPFDMRSNKIVGTTLVPPDCLIIYSAIFVYAGGDSYCNPINLDPTTVVFGVCATSLSDDMSVVVGTALQGCTDYGWYASEGLAVCPEDPPLATLIFENAAPIKCSADGEVLLCWEWDDTIRPCPPWQQAVFSDPFPGDGSGDSGAGTGGCGPLNAPIYMPFLYFPDLPSFPKTYLSHPAPINCDITHAHDLSSDGTVAVGRGATGNEEFPRIGAVAWRNIGQTPQLLDAEEEFGDSVATAVSADGTTIVGVYRLTAEGEHRAFIWDDVNGMQDLKAALQAGGADMDEWILEEPWGISDDGKTITGTGLHTPNGGFTVFASWVLVPDCNANGVNDTFEIRDNLVTDCNGNGVPDDCDVADGTSPDCNNNGISDVCDIADATSPDCDGNGVPDECDPDCNANNVPDMCETMIDVAIIIDTSGSMADVIEGLCDILPGILDELEQSPIDGRITIFNIAGASPGDIPCVSDESVRSVFDDCVPNTTYCLGECGEDDVEDWGTATAVVAGNNVTATMQKWWRPGAARIIVPISDDTPYCGTATCDWPGGDDEAIINAAVSICMSACPRVHVFPVLPHVLFSPEICVQTPAQSLATRTGGMMTRLSSESSATVCIELRRHLLIAISSAAPLDTDLDGIPDSCEPNAVTPYHCPTDYNFDNVANSSDFFEFLTDFYAFNPRSDFNGDCIINSNDFFAFTAALQNSCTPTPVTTCE